MASPNNLFRLKNDEQNKVAVQETTFTVDALGRFICSQWDEVVNNGGPPFDAVVIGAGMYGAYCAERIVRNGGKVLVLEAGPFLVSEHVQNLARIGLNTPSAVLPESEEGRKVREQVWGIAWRGNQIFPGLAYCVGGKSLYWGGWSPRLTDDVLAKWPKAARDYLKATYPSVERLIGVAETTDFIENAPLKAALQTKVNAAVSSISTLERSQPAPLAVQGRAPEGSSGLFSFDKYSSAPLLTDAIREDAGAAGLDDSARNIFLVPRVHVTNLETSGGQVIRLHGRSNDRALQLDIPSSTKVVLAMSTIESTRLALESFPTALMGRNLMVHLRSNTTIRVRRSVFAGLPVTPLQTTALHVPGKASNGGRFHLQLTAAADPNSNSDAVWFRMIPNIEELDRILANQNADWIAITMRGCGEMQGHKDRGTPNTDLSWIDLSPYEFDENGFRRAYVHLKTTAADDTLWNEMDDAAIRLAKALANNNPNDVQYLHSGGWQNSPPPFGKLNYEGGVRDPLGTTYHECGTLWMGTDASNSVTTTSGRFHHISNAYCADQSLFTTSGSANPVPTGLVLARRVAEDILNDGALPLQDGFIDLFDFDRTAFLPKGWRQLGSGGFTRRGRVMETNGGFGLLVYDTREFKNFELRVEWRCPRPMQNNSGVFLRVNPKASENEPDQGKRALAVMLTGYEVQIDDSGEVPDSGTRDAFHQTGCVYERAPSTRVASRAAGQWNDFKIIARDDTFSVDLNGVRVCDFTATPENSGGKPRPRSGHIALQNHFKGSRVQFRNVRIKPL